MPGPGVQYAPVPAPPHTPPAPICSLASFLSYSCCHLRCCPQGFNVHLWGNEYHYTTRRRWADGSDVRETDCEDLAAIHGARHDRRAKRRPRPRASLRCGGEQHRNPRPSSESAFRPDGTACVSSGRSGKIPGEGLFIGHSGGSGMAYGNRSMHRGYRGEAHPLGCAGCGRLDDTCSSRCCPHRRSTC